MARISQNKLTPLLVLLAALVVGVILYQQGRSDALPAGAPMEAVPSAELPATQRGADADTPDETLRTVVGETRALASEVRHLREENKRLRGNSGRVAMEGMREQLRRELRGELRAELTEAKASLSPAAAPPESTGTLGRVLGGAPGQLAGALPEGFGFSQGAAAASAAALEAAPVDAGRKLLPVGYRLGKGADGRQGIVRDTPVAAAGVIPARAAAPAPTKPAVEITPYFTIPENATLLGATAMTALIGRVPVDGRVTDPMQFKLLLGPENLAANGHFLPDDLAGVVVSGVAIGDMALSCSEGLIQSMTFVYNDGAIHTVSRRSNGTTPGVGGASGARSSLSEAPKLGYISDRYGNPCIAGRFVTNAPAYLTDVVGLRTLSLAGKAAAASQTTQSTNAFGG